MKEQRGSTSHPTNTIATQTDDYTNLGQCVHPLTQKQHYRHQLRQLTRLPQKPIKNIRIELHRRGNKK